MACPSRDLEAVQLLASDPVLSTIVSRLATGTKQSKTSFGDRASNLELSMSSFLLEFGELQMQRQIGEGSFGRVRAGRVRAVSSSFSLGLATDYAML